MKCLSKKRGKYSPCYEEKYKKRWQTLRRWLNRGVKNAPCCRQSHDSDLYDWVLACMDEINRTSKTIPHDF